MRKALSVVGLVLAAGLVVVIANELARTPRPPCPYGCIGRMERMKVTLIRDGWPLGTFRCNRCDGEVSCRIPGERVSGAFTSNP